MVSGLFSGNRMARSPHLNRVPWRILRRRSRHLSRLFKSEALEPREEREASTWVEKVAQDSGGIYGDKCDCDAGERTKGPKRQKIKEEEGGYTRCVRDLL